MSTDNLGTLPDSELNELFAIEVAGYSAYKSGWLHSPPPLRSIVPLAGLSFTTDANAVLPWLEKHHTRCNHYLSSCGDPAEWQVVINESEIAFGIAPTFARAAVIALLRAKRAD